MTPDNLLNEINGLLEQRQIPLRQRNKVLADILDLHYTSVQKKMIGQKPWTSEQLMKICEHFGVSLNSLTGDKSAAKVPALIRFGKKIQRGRIHVGQEIDDPALEDFIATQTADGWVVIPGNTASHEKCYHIISMETLPPPFVALLDDEAEIRSSIAKNLSQIGFNTAEYADADSLLADCDKMNFEGFILDWMLSNNMTAENVIHHIRALPKGKTVPIIILTGKLETHLVEESELAYMVQLYKVMVFEKPMRSKIIGMTLFSKIAEQ